MWIIKLTNLIYLVVSYEDIALENERRDPDEVITVPNVLYSFGIIEQSS